MADDKVAAKDNADTTNNHENSSVESDFNSKNEIDKALAEKDHTATNSKSEAEIAHEGKDLAEKSKSEAEVAHEGKDLAEKSKSEGEMAREGKDLAANSKSEVEIDREGKDLEANSKSKVEIAREGKDLPRTKSKNEGKKAHEGKDLAEKSKSEAEIAHEGKDLLATKSKTEDIKASEGKDLPAANTENKADKAHEEKERNASSSALSAYFMSLVKKRSLGSSADTNSRKSSSGVPAPTTDEISDGDISSLSTTSSSSSDEKTATERDFKSVGAKRSCSTKDSTAQTSTDRPKDKVTATSCLNELYFSDFDDQSIMNVDLYRAILESLRDLQKPKEVDISKVVSRRPKRRRSNESGLGDEDSPDRAECPRSPKRILRETSTCPPNPLPSGGSLQDNAESVIPNNPTVSSREATSKAKQHKTERTPTKDKSANATNASKFPECSTSKKSDCLGILKYDAASALKQQTGAASSSAPVKDSPDSPPPSSRPKRHETSVPCPVPIQTPGNLIIADRSTNDPHARRINSLTSLVDRLVDFSNYMDSHPLLSVPGPAPRRVFTQGEFSLPGNYRTLRELEEAFRRGVLALQEDTSDSEDSEEDEAAKAFKKSVLNMRDHLRQLADGIAIYSDSDQEETVAPSDDPVTIEEIRRFLPRLWQGLRYNNMLMNQWTATLLHWCLELQPESQPQQFYDAETGIRGLFGRIDDVRRSTARLLNRWRHRRMDTPELGDLTYLMTMASAAMSLYSTLESEVINARYAMGTRNRRRPREEPEADAQCKKSRKDDSDQSKRGKKE